MKFPVKCCLICPTLNQHHNMHVYVCSYKLTLTPKRPVMLSLYLLLPKSMISKAVFFERRVYCFICAMHHHLQTPTNAAVILHLFQLQIPTIPHHTSSVSSNYSEQELLFVRVEEYKNYLTNTIKTVAFLNCSQIIVKNVNNQFTFADLCWGNHHILKCF